MSGWIGVDLDGTLAVYDGRRAGEIGEPVPAMHFRVRKWIADGVTVKIVTARACVPQEKVRVAAWLAKHDMEGLEITNQKDFAMIELWDDRAVTVEYNTGKVIKAARK